MSEDSGQLLDSDLDSSLSHSGDGGQAVKNWRSKSLPAPYLTPAIRIPFVPREGGHEDEEEDHHEESGDELKTNCRNEASPGKGARSPPPPGGARGGGNGAAGSKILNGPPGKDVPNPAIIKKINQLDKIGRKQLLDAQRREQDSDSKKRSEWRTLQQHYYPEGGWGWVITFCALSSHALTFGSQVYISNVVFQHFHQGWLGALSMGVSLFLSPVWVSICKRKSTRLAAVFGGLVASLGCLFTSFASQYHQLFFSYGAFLGIGVGLTRDASSLMVGQYFKRKRELVEIIVVAGSGLGLVVMSTGIHAAIRSLGWRLGLQTATGALFATFFLGTCYRSASLYHPQRRAILHLKNQKRKVKDKEKREDKPPFLDFTCLRSKTLQILLLSAAITAAGINNPLFFLVKEARENKVLDFSMILLYIYVGVAWILGACLCGLLSVQKNQECRVSKQYLCQVASLICGISIFALTAVKGFHGLVIFSWVYGFSLGGYNYSLKVYTYERVRARHFPRAWSFLQCSQAIPLVLGVPFTGYLNRRWGWKSGYYFSAIMVILGSAVLFLTDVRRRRLSRRKATNSSIKTCETLESAQSPKSRRLSFSFPPEPNSPSSKHDDPDDQEEGVDVMDPSNILKELTCISEEGLADLDFQDIYFEEWEEFFGGECITSCNKVENCLASECDPEYAGGFLEPRRARRWSAARPNLTQTAHAGIGATAAALASGVAGVGSQHNQRLLHVPALSGVGEGGAPVRARGSLPREIPVFRKRGGHRRLSHPRTISVIDEASM